MQHLFHHAAATARRRSTYLRQIVNSPPANSSHPSIPAHLLAHRTFSTMKTSTTEYPPPDGLSLPDPSLLGHASFINGAFTPPSPASSILTVTNPATGAVVQNLHEASDADVADAVSAAEAAFSLWRTTPTARRSALLRAWHAELVANRDSLARLITLENGKPLREAFVEVDQCASFASWYEHLPARGGGSHAVQRDARTLSVVTREPVGVCALITPWNFPAAMLARKATAALAAGCAVVCKPSELTPLSALALARLATRAGAPDGLFNVVVSSRADQVGERLMRVPAVRMVSFTGSTRVGKLIAGRAAERVLRISLELGGHAPFIVYDDADVDVAVEALVRQKFRNSGQACTSPNRVFVQHGPRYEVFCDKLRARVADVRAGNGLDASSVIGPLINEAAVRKVRAQVDDAVKRGARVLVGGRGEADGTMFPATVVVGVGDDALLAREETFGPVVGVLAFADEAEVVRRANEGTQMGLAAYVFTRDGGRAMRAARDLQYGMVGVNDVGLSCATAPFGGVKESGVGREGGADGLECYTEVKHALLRF